MVSTLRRLDGGGLVFQEVGAYALEGVRGNLPGYRKDFINLNNL